MSRLSRLAEGTKILLARSKRIRRALFREPTTASAAVTLRAYGPGLDLKSIDQPLDSLGHGWVTDDEVLHRPVIKPFITRYVAEGSVASILHSFVNPTFDCKQHHRARERTEAFFKRAAS